jgi:hypothetical protein
MGIFADAADKVKAEREAAGWKPPAPMPEPVTPITPPPVYRLFALKDGREYDVRYLAGRCCSGSEGGRGLLYHAVTIRGLDGGDALCGAKPGFRSAGFARPHPSQEAVVTCPRCLSKIKKMKS